MSAGITLIRVYWFLVMLTLLAKGLGSWISGWFVSWFLGPNQTQAFGILEIFVAGALIIGIFVVGQMGPSTFYYALFLQGLLISDSGVLTSPNLGNVFLTFINLLVVGALVRYAVIGEVPVLGEAVGDVDAWIVFKSGLAVIAGAITYFIFATLIGIGWTGQTGGLLDELKRELQDFIRWIGG